MTTRTEPFVESDLQQEDEMSEYKCSACMDTGCRCGGVGLSCSGGCCTCDTAKAIRGELLRPAEDRLREALLDIWRVMGPQVPKSINCCQGCDHEWGEALRIIKEALPGEELPYEKDGKS